MISRVTKLIQERNINIASLHCDRYAKGEEASMCICLDGELDEQILKLIEGIENLYLVRYVKKLEQ